MNIFDLTSNQLKRAGAIKEQIENLSKDLASILGVSANPRVAQKKMRTTSASGNTRVAAIPAQLSVKPAVKPKTKTMSSATRAKLSAKLKAYWVAKKAGKK